MNLATKTPAALEKLKLIQQQMQIICSPGNSEHYTVTSEGGFIRITVPKNK